MRKHNQKNKIELIYNYLIIMNKKKLKWKLVGIYMLKAPVQKKNPGKTKQMQKKSIGVC